MNARQRRVVRRAAVPEFTGCGAQAYSGATPYPDLMCVDGRMADMDADGWNPTTWRVPCAHCMPTAYVEHLQELFEEMEESK